MEDRKEQGARVREVLAKGAPKTGPGALRDDDLMPRMETGIKSVPARKESKKEKKARLKKEQEKVEAEKVRLCI